MLLFATIVFAILILSVIKVYLIFRTTRCKSKVCLIGKTAIITGANTGIGYETALEFAKRGARVILACRNIVKAEQAKNKIISLTENNNVIVKELNLSSLQSVRYFVKDVQETEQKIHILVNNAGSGILPQKYTDDGLQTIMQINYFAPCLLTILLLDVLKNSGPSRIINVSSTLAGNSDLTVENINKPRKGVRNYENSKLGNILFTIKLAELLRNSNITVYSLHPGAVATDIFNGFPAVIKLIVDFFSYLYFKTPEEGAQTTLHTSLEQGIEKYSGRHFEECEVVPTYKKAKETGLVDKIWNETIKILKLEKEISKLLNNVLE